MRGLESLPRVSSWIRKKITEALEEYWKNCLERIGGEKTQLDAYAWVTGAQRCCGLTGDGLWDAEAPHLDGANAGLRTRASAIAWRYS